MLDCEIIFIDKTSKLIFLNQFKYLKKVKSVNLFKNISFATKLKKFKKFIQFDRKTRWRMKNLFKSIIASQT